MPEIAVLVPETDHEKMVVNKVLSLMRAGWDHVQTNLVLDVRSTWKRGEQYASGARDMGAIFAIAGWGDRPKDAVAGEVMEPSTANFARVLDALHRVGSG